MTGATAKHLEHLRKYFPLDRVVPVVQALGASTYSDPRALTVDEKSREDRACSTLSLLTCVGMNLRHFLSPAKVFAMTKANFGWVARAPTLQLSKKLSTRVFKHAQRVRYSSP